MPKQLLLIRHAKSDWGDPGLKDFDRPLNSRGERNASDMAKRLIQKKMIPQQIVSSPALRAITTAGLFAEQLGLAKSHIVQEPVIYESSVAVLIKVINNLSEKSDFTALFGHNPAITQVVQELCGKDLYNIPTCGMALISFPFDSWNMLSAGTGDLLLYDYPKNED